MYYPEELMRRTLNLSERNFRKSLTIPFAAEVTDVSFCVSESMRTLGSKFA